jgi:hypothetical protein
MRTMKSVIRFSRQSFAVIGVAILPFALALGTEDALAQTNGLVRANKQTNRPRPVVVVPYVPPSPYAPYYYSRWNPYSAYSVYDHLSGGRQQCQLPTEPCDNTHRVTN